MNLQPEDHTTIAAHPLGESLDDVRYMWARNGVFNSRLAMLLLDSLRDSPVAEILKPSGLRDRLEIYLTKAIGTIKSLSLDEFRPLTEAAIGDRPDDEIWDAAVNLVQNLVAAGSIHERPPTPPESQNVMPSSRLGTRSRGSAHASSGNFDLYVLEQRLQEEVWHNTHRGVGNFCETYMDDSTWSSDRKSVRDLILGALEPRPGSTDQGVILKWMREAVAAARLDAGYDVLTQEDGFYLKPGSLDFCFYESVSDRVFDYGSEIADQGGFGSL